MNNSAELSRFVSAQKNDYDTALREIKNGKKTSHWMWYIFPQLRGLGRTSTSEYYGIRGLAEAQAFLKHPYLGRNLIEISEALLELETDDPREVFGHPDDMKLRSCMTLFSAASGEPSVFDRVLAKYFDGIPDRRTERMLGL